MRHHPRPGRALRQGVPRRTVTALPPIMTRSASIRTLTYRDLNADYVSAPDRRIGYDARACHNAPDDGRVRLTRACTHKSLSRVRFRANRTSSRRRRTTESDPRRSLAGSKISHRGKPLTFRQEARIVANTGMSCGSFRRGVATRRSPRLPAETRHARAERPVLPSKAAECPCSRSDRVPRGKSGCALLYR